MGSRPYIQKTTQTNVVQKKCVQIGREYCKFYARLRYRRMGPPERAHVDVSPRSPNVRLDQAWRG